MELLEKLEKQLADLSATCDSKLTRGKITLMQETITEVKDKLEKDYVLGKTSITWGLDDFEYRANYGEVFDKTKFQAALEQMIHEHDAEYGITWDTIDYYLKEMCLKEEV